MSGSPDLSGAEEVEMTQYKRLTDAQLARAKALEAELGCWLVAFEPTPGIARTSEEQLRRLQAWEKQMGRVVVVYEGEPVAAGAERS
jgi:hypothetical protein